MDPALCAGPGLRADDAVHVRHVPAIGRARRNPGAPHRPDAVLPDRGSGDGRGLPRRTDPAGVPRIRLRPARWQLPAGGPEGQGRTSGEPRDGNGHSGWPGHRSLKAIAIITPDTVPGTAVVPSAELAPHLLPLSGGWALWRTVCLRGAGFPLGLLADLGAPALASTADLVNSGTGDLGIARAAYAAEFTAEADRQSSVLHRIASLPLLREAVAWQNRHALETGIDVLLRRGSGTGPRNAQRRRHEALVASYLQRYCAKNDTI